MGRRSCLCRYLRESTRSTCHPHRSSSSSQFPRATIEATLHRVSVITLTTDFGTHDWFVGTLKGVVADIAPKAKVIDLTHDLPPGDIRGGAFVLAAGCRFFPKGTVHVAVVDPGVGSRRKAIAVQTDKGVFVGPDNGVLSWALTKEKITAIHALENEDYFLKPVSQTFHGRDVFAPVSAHLSRGVPIKKFGPALKDFVRLDWPEPRRQRGGIEGEVVYIDRFGNAITNIGSELLRSAAKASCEVFSKRRRVCPLKKFYQDVAAKSPIALSGSSGFLEIAVSGGSAERLLGVRIGTRVVLRTN
jgi:S-adenosyl-L-methionine hydrolase (adenosine-forming)